MSHDPQSPTDAADFDDDYLDDRDLDEEDDGFECGAWFNGKFDFYQLAGTEDCDWECPHSAQAMGLRT